MATRIDLPALGQSMEEGTITAWHKKEGDSVTQGETLYEVMTDKANFEQEAPVSGILRKILVPADEIAAVNSLLAIIGTTDEPIDHLLTGGVAPASQPPEEPQPAAENAAPAASMAHAATAPNGAVHSGGKLFASPRARRVADELGFEVALLAGRGTGIDGRIVEADILAYAEEVLAAQKAGKVTPLASKVAEAHGIDLAAVGSGSGHAGKVVSEDVLRALQTEVTGSAATPAAFPALQAAAAGSSAGIDLAAIGDDKVIPLTGMRRMIADNVARSAQTAPHVTLTLGVDMHEATRFRKQLMPSIEKSHGVRITFTDIIAKATARALVDHPMINSSLTANKITLHKAIHLGIAVSLGEGGLVVPTLRNADKLTLPEISIRIKALAGKAREGKLGPDEMTGGTFSITNLGTYGVESFNPIINPPQCAILGVCTIKDTISAVDGKPEVRPIMNLCLSFDHRITDGAPAAAFLARLKEILEQPYLIFM